MLYLITGGSGSGKSAYAERTAVSLYTRKESAGGLYYVATMYPYEDEETKQRIERHRSMRRGKGFETIECRTGLAALLPQYPCDKEEKGVFLIECMSNLLANEMYLRTGGLRTVRGTGFDKAAVFDKAEETILAPIVQMVQLGADVVVVTNEVFSDVQAGRCDGETGLYIELLGHINRRLAAQAEYCVEVVCGIPVMLGDRASVPESDGAALAAGWRTE